MKTLITSFSLILLLFVSSSCSNEDEPEIKGQTSYTVTSDIDIDQFIGNSSIQANLSYTFFEYNENNEVVNIQKWNNVRQGDSKVFSASDMAVKMTIQIKVDAKSGNQEATLTRYCVQIFYLKLHQDNKIVLDGNTQVVSYNPI